MGPRETRCQEASAGDRRAIADAEQTEQLDISGEPRTAKHYAMRFQAQEEDSVERAALRHRFHRSAVHRHRRRLVACWQKKCRLYSSSEQLLPLANHMTWILVAKTARCQFTYLHQHFRKKPKKSALEGEDTINAVSETKSSWISNMFRGHYHLQTAKERESHATRCSPSLHSWLMKARQSRFGRCLSSTSSHL